MKNKKKKSVCLALLFLVAVCCVRCFHGEREYKSCEGVVWATEYHITYQSSVDLSDSIQTALMLVDNSLSQFNNKSLVTEVNNNETNQLDTMFVAVYKASEKIWKETGGAFDPTVSPLVNAWGFGYKSGLLPDSAMIDSIKVFVGLDKTSLMAGNKMRKKDRRTAFDFSAIAKGYGCDEVGRMFERNGVTNYMVEIGGEISSCGVNPRGEKWHVSVDRPIESRDTVIHESALVIEVERAGIATSGNYRNFKVVDGRKVAHTINPSTGYPELSNLLSATIVTDNCMNADGYATACMVMGLERSQNLFSNSNKIGVMLIYADENGDLCQWCNEHFKSLVPSKN